MSLVLNFLYKLMDIPRLAKYLMGAIPLCCNRLRLKYDDTRAETIFRLSAKRTSPFKSAVGVSSVDY